MLGFLAALIPVLAGGESAPPSWVDTGIAGYELSLSERRRPICVFDRRTGYFLLRESECDGGLLTLLLTRDRKVIAACGFKFATDKTGDGTMLIVERPLRNLATGKGIQVGDAEHTLIRQLGKPTELKITGPHRQYRCIEYKWAGERFRYDESYTFKAGRLVEISFLRESS